MADKYVKDGKRIFTVRFYSAEEFEKGIERYFASLEGEQAVDKDGVPMFSKKDNSPLWVKKPEAPSMAGLAVFLGFSSLQSMDKYRSGDFAGVTKEEKVRYCDAYSSADMRIQSYNEQRLYDRETAVGAQFALVNKYGYKSAKQDINATADGDGFKLSFKVGDPNKKKKDKKAAKKTDEKP